MLLGPKMKNFLCETTRPIALLLGTSQWTATKFVQIILLGLKKKRPARGVTVMFYICRLYIREDIIKSSCLKP